MCIHEHYPPTDDFRSRVLDENWTLSEVERVTRLSRATLYRRLHNATLKGFKLDNGAWRVPHSEVLKLMGGPTPVPAFSRGERDDGRA